MVMCQRRPLRVTVGSGFPKKEILVFDYGSPFLSFIANKSVLEI